MDKAIEADGSETEPDAVAGLAQAAFGDDDLGKLQNILIGDHARRTFDRIDTLEHALLGAIDDLRAELHDQVATIDARIGAEADLRSKAMTNMTSRIDDEASSHADSLKQIQTDLRSTESDLQVAIDSAASGLTGHVDELRETTADLAKADADLNSAKVDRAALARLLSAAVDGLQSESGEDS